MISYRSKADAEGSPWFAMLAVAATTVEGEVDEGLRTSVTTWREAGARVGRGAIYALEMEGAMMDGA